MIQITEAAARRILALRDKEGLEAAALRIGVKAGGCSGLSYVFTWERDPRPDDEIFEGPDNTKICVDKKSYKYLDGTILDCDTDMLGQTLLFRNPNASSTCGCGTSFSV